MAVLAAAAPAAHTMRPLSHSARLLIAGSGREVKAAAAENHRANHRFAFPVAQERPDAPQGAQVYRGL